MDTHEEAEVQFTGSRSKACCSKKNLFCTEYGAEDITILRDGLAFLSTVSCISAVSLNEIVDQQF